MASKDKPRGEFSSNGLPRWLSKRIPTGGQSVNRCLDDLQLGTVCTSARCPNKAECYAKGRATFLLMGPNCTRHCGFCAVGRLTPAPLDTDEPRRVAQAVKRLALRHVVITSVTRDDLPDGGAAHFARTVAEVKALNPGVSTEILTPDFADNREAWAVAADAGADVFNHNMETVPRLYAKVRPEAVYERSLALLAFAKQRHPEMRVKSGLMVGLGETVDEILAVGRDLVAAGVDMLTVGQYLRPSADHNLPVEYFMRPEEFAELEVNLKGLGFRHVAASPFVRSSYNAEEALADAGQTPDQGNHGAKENR